MDRRGPASKETKGKITISSFFMRVSQLTNPRGAGVYLAKYNKSVTRRPSFTRALMMGSKIGLLQSHLEKGGGGRGRVSDVSGLPGRGLSELRHLRVSRHRCGLLVRDRVYAPVPTPPRIQRDHPYVTSLTIARVVFSAFVLVLPVVPPCSPAYASFRALRRQVNRAA
jgi:hypothetical protein